jgi:hypothetical protein
MRRDDLSSCSVRELGEEPCSVGKQVAPVLEHITFVHCITMETSKALFEGQSKGVVILDDKPESKVAQKRTKAC